MSAIVKYPRAPKLAALVLLVLAVLGCTVRLVSPYDQVIDEGVTKFHTDVTAFVGQMVTLAGKTEGTYEANKAFYPVLSAQVASLRMRAALTAKNDATIKSLDEVAANVERLRMLHQSGQDKGLFKALADPALAAIDVQCESILKLEIAKKRGEQ